jgi:hypothetical protein
VPDSDNARDLGDSGLTLRWRDGWFARNVTVGGTMQATGSLTTGASSTVGFFNAAAVGQQSGTGNAHTVAAGSTTSVFTNTTFDGSIGATGYTVGDIVKALKNLGLLAQ